MNLFRIAAVASTLVVAGAAAYGLYQNYSEKKAKANPAAAKPEAAPAEAPKAEEAKAA